MCIRDRYCNQKAYKVRQIIEGCNLSRPADILNKNNEDILQKWLLDYTEKNSGKSTVTYINVLKFYRFLVLKEDC